MLLGLFQSIIDGFAAVLGGIVWLLPSSPFKMMNALTVDNELLSALAWIIPFPQIIVLLEAWGTAILGFYMYMVIARWIKLLGE